MTDNTSAYNYAGVIFVLRKIISIAVIALVLIIAVSGCNKEDTINYLDYQTYPFEANGVLTYDGKDYSVEVKSGKSGDLELKVNTPSELSGVVFSITGGNVKVGDEQINDGGYSANNGILLSNEMFSLSSGSLSGAGTKEDKGVTYSYAVYTAPHGEVTVYTQTGLKYPERIEAVLNGHNFKFVFKN